MQGNFLFSNQPKGKVLLLTHRTADPDAICSAAFLKTVFANKTVEIGVPDNINAPAKHIAEQLEIIYIINPDLSRFDSIVLVEASTAEMLGSLAGSFKDFKGTKFLVGHHSNYSHAEIPEKNKSVDAKAVSTTELLYRLYKKEKYKFKPVQASLLALGLIADSAQFLNATSQTFLSMHDLLEKSQYSYNELLALLSQRQDFGSKIAGLKSLRSLSVWGLGGFTAVTLSNPSDTAILDNLIFLGADIVAGLTIHEKYKQVVLTVHAGNYWTAQTNLDLSKTVFKNLAHTFSGSFGGHAAVGSLSCSAQ